MEYKIAQIITNKPEFEEFKGKIVVVKDIIQSTENPTEYLYEVCFLDKLKIMECGYYFFADDLQFKQNKLQLPNFILGTQGRIKIGAEGLENSLVSEYSDLTEIDEDSCIQLILAKYPGFYNDLEYTLNYWEGEDLSFMTTIATFSTYVIKLFTSEISDFVLLKDIFDFAEKLMTNGNDNVQTAIATCFLENILNVLPNKYHQQFVALLGAESKKYCKAWNEFTEVEIDNL